MSQSSPASATPSSALPAQRRAGSPLALRNWPVARRLIAGVAIPAVLGLALAGIRISDTTRSAAAYGQAGRLAAVGLQVTGLAQALEDERADTAAFIAGGRQAAGLVALRRQYVITDGWAAAVSRLVLRLGPGYPAATRAATATALASMAELPGLRRHAAQASALTMIDGYSAAIAGLFPVEDGIADPIGNSALISSARALGALSRMKDQASQQQAILGAALAQGHFAPGAVTALTIAQAMQAGDLVSFRSSATPEESWALIKTLAGPLPGQARAVEQSATAAGDGALVLGTRARQQWQSGMSYTVGWMRQAEQQLAGWITSYAQALQRSAQRSTIITGGAALAALALIVLATMIIARSMVRPLRRIEAAAVDVAEARLPAQIHALGEIPLGATPIDVRATDEIGKVARAVDQVHRQALRLAAEETRLQRHVSAILTGFFWRSHSLLERLLPVVDRLELGEDDPERLASLFQMDHLVTRMRRNSDSALVLAGHGTSRRSPEPVTLADVLRAAVSEIEQYDRVSVEVQLGVSVSGGAVADTVHLLAELLENATTFSPETTEVIASGHTPRGGGLLISITDGGAGMPEEQLSQLNRQLARPLPADGPVARHMGLLTVARLAARHGITVVLSRQPGGGTTAEVHLPAALISQGAMPGGWLRQAAGVRQAGPGGRAGVVAAAAGWRPSAPRFPVGQEIVSDEAVPVPLGAPLPSPAPETSATYAAPESAAAEPGGALPIFESVETDYRRTRGLSLPRPGQPQAARPTPAADVLNPAGLPRRMPQRSHDPGAPADRARQQATAAESAQAARSRLASFHRGSRRARAGIDREANQPAQDD